MAKGKKSSFMERVSSFIVNNRSLVLFVYIAAAVFSIFSRNWVNVNDIVTDYLPATTETRLGLDIMENEFFTYATADVMVENITYEQAQQIASELETVRGVKSVEFDDTQAHYAGAAALFKVTFDGDDNDEVSIEALAAVREHMSAYDLYISSEVGNPLAKIIDDEMLTVDIIAFVIIIIILLLTSRTYGEVPVLLITFGASALINMGTNYWMGTISFVTDSITIVMQLALGIDYAVILCHRFTDEHADKPAREAAIAALAKAIPEISASSLTTMAGLLALTFMKFRLGYDLGIVLIKAIIISLITVFTLMPNLLVMFSKLIDRTHHKSFVPRVSFLGKLAYKTRYIVPPVFLVAVISAYVLFGRNNYVYSQYSVDSIRHNDAQLAQKKIDETFGKLGQVAIIIPTGDYYAEAEMIEDINQLGHTTKVTALSCTEVKDGYNLTTPVTPRQFAEIADVDYEIARLIFTGYAMDREDYGQIVTSLDRYSAQLIDVMDYLFLERNEMSLTVSEETGEKLDELEKEIEDAELQLRSEKWTRVVIDTDLPDESPASFGYIDIIHGIVARYYDESYVIGETTSCMDLRESFENDNIMISVFSIVFVVLVLIFTFKSVGLPFLLIIIIQGSIWINFTLAYFRNVNVYFLTYLIINAIQMGANIDYAIVISSRYMEFKEKMDLRETMIATINGAFPTLFTSGAIMCLAGVAIGFIASNETISNIGIYLGTGTAISLFLVLGVLPQILLLGDIIIKKTSFSIDASLPTVKRIGRVRLNGRVRGQLNGMIDAEIHGVFYGDLNALVDIGNTADLPDIDLDGDAGLEEDYEK